MARRKRVRWADGDTRPDGGFVFVGRKRAAALGLPLPANAWCEGDFYEEGEVARAELLARYNTPATANDETWPRWWVVLLAIVALHIGIACWAVLVS